MSLPENLKTNLQKDLEVKNLLLPDFVKTVMAQLDKNQPVNWNIVLNQQFAQEKGGIDAPQD